MCSGGNNRWTKRTICTDYPPQGREACEALALLVGIPCFDIVQGKWWTPCIEKELATYVYEMSAPWVVLICARGGDSHFDDVRPICVYGAVSSAVERVADTRD